MTNIAVLLEPFPIRNTFGAHAWIGERLVQMLLSTSNAGVARTDMRIICNAPTMTYIVERHPAARPYLLQAPAVEQAPFTAAMADWHTSGVAVWAAIQAGSHAHEAHYEALLKTTHAVYPFDVLAYWGTNETLRAVADRLQIPMLWAEYGPLRSPFPAHLCLDSAGVNGHATGRADLQLKRHQAPVMPAASLEMQFGNMSAYETTLLLPPAEAAAPFARLMRFAKGHRHIILLVMQLADDANILAFSDGWTSQRMIEVILKLRAGPDTVFVLRPHPGEANSFHNFAAGNAVRDAVQGREDVLVFDDAGGGGYMACLSVVTEIVCINSSVGFEAMLLGKPVRVLGHASYMPPGGGADLSAPPMQLDEGSIELLLRDRFIPEEHFWTVECWHEKAEALVAGSTIRVPGLLPRLPTATAKVLGSTRQTEDGVLFVDGVGVLAILPSSATGTVDDVSVIVDGSAEYLVIRGWGKDTRTDSMVAGFIIKAGERSVWSASLSLRPDVARVYNSPSALATGFAIRLARQDMPLTWSHPIEVFGVTVGGFCSLLENIWQFDPESQKFAVHKPLVLDTV